MSDIQNTETRPLPNPFKIFFTPGVLEERGKGFDNPDDDYLFMSTLARAIREQYEKEPDVCLDGGTDKYFFTLTWRNTKFFVAANEVNGLTIMKPEEY
jgi:hypothetical protein